jgi:hypothetical protein
MKFKLLIKVGREWKEVTGVRKNTGNKWVRVPKRKWLAIK